MLVSLCGNILCDVDLIYTFVFTYPHLTQVPSWAWAMYRRNWTAYQAGRLTRTCPMPTRPLPPMARTHEDQHTSPFSPLLPPSLPSTSVTLHLPSLPSLHSQHLLHHKDVGEKRGSRGEGGGVDTQLFLRHPLPLSPQGEELTLSSHYAFSRTSFPFPFLFFFWLLRWGQVFVTVTWLSVTWEEMGYRETNGGCVKVGMGRGGGWVERDWLQEWKRFIHPFIVMVQLVFLL